MSPNPDLNSIRKATAVTRVSTAGILGGSTTYGRFYNVKGAPAMEAASDVDLMLIVPDVKEISALCEALTNVSALDSDSVNLFARRAEIYEVLRDEVPGSEVLFSQKIPIWKNVPDDFLAGTGIWPQYDVSIHIATLGLFSGIILEDVPRIEDDACVKIVDYRADVPIPRYAARGFNGIDSWRDSEYSPVDRGHMWRVQVFDTKDEDSSPVCIKGL